MDLTSKLVGTSSKKYVAVKWALLKGRMSFMGFFRDSERAKIKALRGKRA